MRTLSSSARCCQNICSTRIVGRSAVMHGRYCSFFTRNKSFSRNLHRVCIIGKVPRRQFLRESRIENRVEYRDSILDPRFSRESSVNLHLGGTVSAQANDSFTFVLYKIHMAILSYLFLHTVSHVPWIIPSIL